jgi:hypothetical protein
LRLSSARTGSNHGNRRLLSRTLTHNGPRVATSVEALPSKGAGYFVRGVPIRIVARSDGTVGKLLQSRAGAKSGCALPLISGALG